MAEVVNGRWNHRQGGASAFGVLVGVAFLISVVTLTIRLGPHYIDWYTMRSVVGELSTQEVVGMQKGEIRESLERRFRVNNLRGFDLDELVAIERDKDATMLTLDYERREHIVANVDVVLSLNEQFRYQ